MTPRTLLRGAATTALLVALSSACTGGATPPAEQRSPAGDERIAVQSRPGFEGERPVLLAAGQPALNVGEDSCREEDAPVWVCDRDAQERYLVTDAVEAVLREARMDVAGGGTSWTVTLRFDPADRRDLVAVREEARGRGALVLVLDEQRQVLTAVAVPDVARGTIRLSGLAKPEAWETVEVLAGK